MQVNAAQTCPQEQGWRDTLCARTLPCAWTHLPTQTTVCSKSCVTALLCVHSPVFIHSPLFYTQPPHVNTAPPCIHSPPVYTQPPRVYPASPCIPSPSPCIEVFLAPMHRFQGLAWTPVCTAVTGTHRHTAKQGHRYMGAHTCTLGTYPPRGPRDCETSSNLTAGHAQARPAAQGPQTSLLSLLGSSLGGLCPAWQAPPLSSPSDSHCGRMPLRAGVCMPLCPSTLPRGCLFLRRG